MEKLCYNREEIWCLLKNSTHLDCVELGMLTNILEQCTFAQIRDIAEAIRHVSKGK